MPTDTRMCTVNTADEVIMVPYLLKHSRRARYIRLSLDGANLAVLTIPPRVTEAEAVQFLRAQGDWLKSNFGKVKKQPTFLEYLTKKSFLSAHGRKLDLSLQFSRDRARLIFDRDCASARLILNSERAVEPQLVEMLRYFARDVVKPRALDLAARVKRQIYRVTIRDQLRCWGSCSDRETISLNWRLILIPPELHDYIILHELAHLTHLDHSEEYWRLLLSYDSKAVRNDMRISRLSKQIMSLGRL